MLIKCIPNSNSTDGIFLTGVDKSHHRFGKHTVVNSWEVILLPKLFDVAISIVLLLIQVVNFTFQRDLGRLNTTLLDIAAQLQQLQPLPSTTSSSEVEETQAQIEQLISSAVSSKYTYTAFDTSLSLKCVVSSR